MTPEKEIQNSIMSYFKKLKASGIDNYVERRQAGGFAYKMGLPDLWVVISLKWAQFTCAQTLS